MSEEALDISKLLGFAWITFGSVSAWLRNGFKGKNVKIYILTDTQKENLLLSRIKII
jgi:hypothetical protein